MDAPKYIVIEDSSRNTSSCPSTQLISVLVITAEVDLMDQLLVGQSMCHKEVEKKDKCPQHDPLAVENCSSPVRENIISIKII